MDDYLCLHLIYIHSNTQWKWRWKWCAGVCAWAITTMGPSLPYAQWSVLQLIYNCIFAVHPICFAYRAFGDKFSASCTRVVRPHILAVSTWDTLDLKKIAFIKWTWLRNRRRTRRNKVAFTQFTTGNCIFSVRLFLSLSLSRTNAAPVAINLSVLSCGFSVIQLNRFDWMFVAVKCVVCWTTNLNKDQNELQQIVMIQG